MDEFNAKGLSNSETRRYSILYEEAVNVNDGRKKAINLSVIQFLAMLRISKFNTNNLTDEQMKRIYIFEIDHINVKLVNMGFVRSEPFKTSFNTLNELKTDYNGIFNFFQVARMEYLMNGFHLKDDWYEIFYELSFRKIFPKLFDLNCVEYINDVPLNIGNLLDLVLDARFYKNQYL